MKLLISGVPGTGKTSIGNYLAEHRGFKHVDLESDSGHAYLNLLQQGRFDEFIETAATSGSWIVMSLGFPPECLPAIEQLALRGFRTVWLDAPLIFSRKHWRPDNGQDPKTYAEQILKIIEHHDRVSVFYSGRVVCVCDQRAEGFLPVEEIAERILLAATG